mmetsp:Transcript_11485/g.20327  ORF Transcript_11485/g.20327 Transcript_11485/m.20327 type:complete len:237 (+) Transcript_11485:1642-2352(+)
MGGMHWCVSWRHVGTASAHYTLCHEQPVCTCTLCHGCSTVCHEQGEVSFMEVAGLVTNLAVWYASLIRVLSVAPEHPAQYCWHGELEDLLTNHTAWMGDVEISDPGQWAHTLAQVGLVCSGHQGRHACHAVDGCHSHHALRLIPFEAALYVHPGTLLDCLAHYVNQVIRQLKCILNGHAPSLPKIRLHGVRRVSHEYHAPLSPAGHWGTIIDVAPKHVCLRSGLDQVHDIVVPVTE